MANDLNSVNLIGRLTKDPEIKDVAGKMVCNFTVAVNGYNTVAFINCVAWEKLAEVSAKYLKKGSKVAVVGSIVQQRWEKEGKTNSKTEIRISQLQFLDNKDQTEK